MESRIEHKAPIEKHNYSFHLAYLNLSIRTDGGRYGEPSRRGDRTQARSGVTVRSHGPAPAGSGRRVRLSQAYPGQ